MDMETIKWAVAGQVANMIDKSGVITLGELFYQLHVKWLVLSANYGDYDGRTLVKFDTGEHVGNFHSYHGYCNFPAIDAGHEPKRLVDFIHQVREATGGTFTGYKGGEFTMNRRSPVWASEYGRSSGRGVLDAQIVYDKDGHHYIELVTGMIDE